MARFGVRLGLKVSPANSVRVCNNDEGNGWGWGYVQNCVLMQILSQLQDPSRVEWWLAAEHGKRLHNGYIEDDLRNGK